MVSSNYYNKDEFDEMLAKSLKRHSEPVRTNFTNMVINHIEEERKRELLRKIVLQERFALGLSIALAIFLLSGIIFFGKEIAQVMLSSFNSLRDIPVKTLTSYSPDWQLIIAAIAAIGSVIFAFSDTLNLRQRVIRQLFR